MFRSPLIRKGQEAGRGWGRGYVHVFNSGQETGSASNDVQLLICFHPWWRHRVPS